MNKSKKPEQTKPLRPPQRQRRQPGLQWKMRPLPEDLRADYRGSGKLQDRVALITGGDSGIGRAVAVLFAREGCDIAVVYRDEHRDARDCRELIEREGRRCLLIAGDIGDERFCRDAVRMVRREFGRLDILVNNAAEQHPQESFEQVTAKQMERTFRTNIFSMFHLTRAALPLLRRQAGSSIINTTSVTAYRGSPHLIDYAATKGAIVSFTRSLAQALVEDGIRVNAVAPGPIWTPLIPATFERKKVAEFGSDVPLKRAGEPSEVAGCFLFLASDAASYMTGQVLHPNGGEIING